MSLLTGTLFLMWLGEQITDKGIGNGISMVITINIVSRLPAALGQGWQMLTGTGGTDTALSPMLIIPLDLLPLRGHRRHHRHHPGAAQGHDPIRQAGPR